MNTGVYTILCTVTGDVYVGAAWISFWVRWERHVDELRAGKHTSVRFQWDWDRYGEDTFRFSEVEYCCGKMECLVAEQRWMAKLRSEGIQLYNKKSGYYGRSRSELPSLVHRRRNIIESAKNLTVEQLAALIQAFDQNNLHN